jgi:hypothetical protein
MQSPRQQLHCHEAWQVMQSNSHWAAAVALRACPRSMMLRYVLRYVQSCRPMHAAHTVAGVHPLLASCLVLMYGNRSCSALAHLRRCVQHAGPLLQYSWTRCRISPEGASRHGCRFARRSRRARPPPATACLRPAAQCARPGPPHAFGMALEME